MNRRCFLGDDAERFPLDNPLKLVGERPHFNLAACPVLAREHVSAPHAGLFARTQSAGTFVG
jgi:hypothetical protein